jgi:hypothetical protein
MKQKGCDESQLTGRQERTFFWPRQCYNTTRIMDCQNFKHLVCMLVADVLPNAELVVEVLFLDRDI